MLFYTKIAEVLERPIEKFRYLFVLWRWILILFISHADRAVVIILHVHNLFIVTKRVVLLYNKEPVNPFQYWLLLPILKSVKIKICMHSILPIS